MKLPYVPFLEVFAPTLLEPHQCPVDTPLSCSNKTEVVDSCCFEFPGGILLQTQFWDYYPPVGPTDMFTLHGLWPDNCDGSYEQFCDYSSTISSARRILEEAGEGNLLDKMNRFWKNFNGDDDYLWVHEFNKHGTCMSTLKPSCYGASSTTSTSYQNVIDFFQRSVELFETLPTYQWLVEDGIVPSEVNTYSRKQIEDSLSSHFGHEVYVSCNKFSALQEVWYFHHLRGSVISGDFVPIPAMLNSRCPQQGIKFLPKNFVPPRPTHTGDSPIPRPTDGHKYYRGHLTPVGQPGCIISNGRWYTSGTCATFNLIQAPFGGYNLKSSKGFCAVDKEGYLTCGSQVTARQFQYDKSSGYVSFGGLKGWSAETVPGRFKQVPVAAGKDGGAVTFELHL
ncbi:DEKNAAC102373 [Brettanomyces naardenensis]|uniref:Ribonuclease T2-like n=1 Tax=Brettanomyces naardenensis TaxID=13370 RepID=A0A448YLE2_BRENA|nr:DEKNAAC102373 [Brettanomyces naardenensis]